MSGTSERERTEEMLRRSEHDLRESKRIALVGSWRLDIATIESDRLTLEEDILRAQAMADVIHREAAHARAKGLSACRGRSIQRFPTLCVAMPRGCSAHSPRSTVR